MAPTIVPAVAVAAAQPLFEGGQPLDLIDLADVKEELQIDNKEHDKWLGKTITRCSMLASRYCNRVFQQQTYREQIWAYRDPFPWQVRSGFFPLQLAAWPLLSAPSPAQTPPPLAPALSAVGGGSVPGTFYVKITYVTPSGETAASDEASLIVASSLLQVASPIMDAAAIATGWNCYVGTTSFGEIQQNESPIGIGAPFTIATSGLFTKGNALPSFILAVENFALQPVPLCEGADFISDYSIPAPDFSKGWLTRLLAIDLAPRRWSEAPILVAYQAGYTAKTLPADLSDAVLQLVKARYFARSRDPALRQETIDGAWGGSYFFGAGPGSEGDLPPNIVAMLDRYRVPVFG
jgi:hypothetical protein